MPSRVTVAAVDAESSEIVVPRPAILATASGAVTVPALAATERVPVSFSGEGAGRGELSWGQRAIWLTMLRQGWLYFGGVMPLPPGKTVRQVADDLGVMMGHYPSMRTRLRFDEAGRPSQELFASGQIALEVYDADADSGLDEGGGDGHSDANSARAEELAALVEARYRTMPRDFVGEWPQRVAVVRSRGELTHLIAVTCHLVTDGFGVEVMNRQLAAGLTGTATGMQPLEQTVWQGSVAGQRQSDASLRYWERMLLSAPSLPMPTSPDPREPRRWAGRLRSPALRAAVPMIAERTSTNGSSVLMALYAVALGKVTGVSPVVVWPLVSNRFRPGLAEVVCNLVQFGICVVEVEGVPFDEVAVRTWRAAISAYKYAYYDAAKHDAMIRRVAPQYGPATGIAYFFNDRRTQGGRAVAEAAMTSRQLSEAGERGTFEWIERMDNPFERILLNVEDDPEAVVLSIFADTHFFSPAQIEELMRQMEAVAISAAAAA